jgi:hypothetical protein
MLSRLSAFQGQYRHPTLIRHCRWKGTRFSSDVFTNNTADIDDSDFSVRKLQEIEKKNNRAGKAVNRGCSILLAADIETVKILKPILSKLVYSPGTKLFNGPRLDVNFALYGNLPMAHQSLYRDTITAYAYAANFTLGK